jgi:hypothetical protein
MINNMYASRIYNMCNILILQINKTQIELNVIEDKN